MKYTISGTNGERRTFRYTIKKEKYRSSYKDGRGGVMSSKTYVYVFFFFIFSVGTHTQNL